MKLELITGDINITTPGNYVIASGCGSGKTSAIIKLITERWSEGIIYAAKTIDECELMKSYLLDEGIESLVLHSASNDNNIYINNPEIISKYHVVICTHHKWMNTPTELLLALNGDDASVPPHMRYWVLGGSSIRKWILIDEMIDKPGFSSYIDSGFLTYMKLAIDSNIISKTKYGYHYYEVKKLYDQYICSGGEYVQSKLDEYKTEYSIGLLAENFDKYYQRIQPGQTSIEVSYTLLDALPGRPNVSAKVRPYFLIFDGTGDIFYKNSSRLQILTTECRYKTKVKFNRFDFNISRYEAQNIDELKSELQSVINELSKVIKTHNRTLIISWLNIKGNLELKINNKTYIAQDFDYYSEVAELLSQSIPADKYALIHYQSGLDRAVNDYLDCDAIVFLGCHKVHSLAIYKYNVYNQTSITQLDYQAQMCVQAICRTLIRLHDPNKVVTAYYSSDWSDTLIEYVDMYINQNSSVNEIYQKITEGSWLNNVLPRWQSKIQLLDEYFDGTIKRHILTTNEDNYNDLTLDIYKHKLNELIPNTGSIHNYDRLLNYLLTLNIRLLILIPDDRYLKISKDGKLCDFTIKQNELDEYVRNGYKIETKFTEYN